MCAAHTCDADRQRVLLPQQQQLDDEGSQDHAQPVVQHSQAVGDGLLGRVGVAAGGAQEGVSLTGAGGGKEVLGTEQACCATQGQPPLGLGHGGHVSTCQHHSMVDGITAQAEDVLSVHT